MHNCASLRSPSILNGQFFSVFYLIFICIFFKENIAAGMTFFVGDNWKQVGIFQFHCP